MKKRVTCPDWLHKVDDGRGPRRVFVDGKLVEQGFYANLRDGYVDAYVQPLAVAVNEKGEESIDTVRLSGHIVVEDEETGERFEAGIAGRGRGND